MSPRSVTHGLDGCEALVSFAAAQGIPEEVLRDNRGWSPDDWETARLALSGRGLLDEGGGLSRAGSELRATIEQTTDRLAGVPLAVLGGDELRVLAAGLGRVARAVTDRGVLPFPNPIGLPEPDRD